MPVLRDWDLPLDTDRVLRGQGADPIRVRSRKPSLIAVAERALQIGLPLVQPSVSFQRLAKKAVTHNRLLLEGDRVLSGALPARHLATADEVVLMLCSVGGELERRASDWMQSEPVLGLALEGLGAAAIEVLAEEACVFFEHRAARAGLKTTSPISPGLSDWPLASGQREIFSSLGSQEEIPAIGLTSGSMMRPRNSLSLVLGIGSRVSRAGGICDHCSMRESCRYRDHDA